MLVRTHSRIYTLGSGVQHTEYEIVTSPGQGPSNKGPGSQSVFLPYMQRGDEATGLDKFCQYGTTTGRITLLPSQYWLKENYKTPANLFKGLKPKSEATQMLLWWCTFKPQPKSMWRPLIEAVVTTDASKEGYGGHMNNLSFQGKWPAKKGKNTHINILEMETVWMACQRFKESLMGKTVSFQIDNTTAVAYVLKEGGTHCKTLNGLARKILLKCHEIRILVCPEYPRSVANLQAAALSKGKKAQK